MPVLAIRGRPDDMCVGGAVVFFSLGQSLFVCFFSVSTPRQKQSFISSWENEQTFVSHRLRNLTCFSPHVLQVSSLCIALHDYQ